MPVFVEGNWPEEWTEIRPIRYPTLLDEEATLCLQPPLQADLFTVAVEPPLRAPRAAERRETVFQTPPDPDPAYTLTTDYNRETVGVQIYRTLTRADAWRLALLLKDACFAIDHTRRVSGSKGEEGTRA